MKIATILACAVLAGCASNSGVVPMGSDTFFISRQSGSAIGGMGVLKAEAFREAGTFCSSKGKTVEVLSENDAKPPYLMGNFPKTEIKFRCV